MPDTEDRQASLNLKFRGLPPLLHSIQFSCPPHTDKVTDLQNRDLPRAVAIALLLFRINSEATLFRIRTEKPTGTLVHTILNAKHQTRGTSCIRDLANGAFLKLFLKSPTTCSSYLDIDVGAACCGRFEKKLKKRAVGEISDAACSSSLVLRIQDSVNKRSRRLFGPDAEQRRFTINAEEKQSDRNCPG